MSDTKPIAKKHYQKVVELSEAADLCKYINEEAAELTSRLTGADLQQQNGYIVIDRLLVISAAARLRSIVRAVRRFAKAEKEKEG
ncbi:MAG TPA: hypothetical protein VLH16_02775 [Bacteroidales bacterium]|nr:hypothetical protein [Bacteroidales bacterium]